MTRNEAYKECIENTLRILYNTSLSEEGATIEERVTLRRNEKALTFAVQALNTPHFFLRGDLKEEWEKDFEKARQELTTEYSTAFHYFT